jgi:AcrR family transcriptional regulator
MSAREKLLAAAAELAAQQGIRVLTQPKVARLAGVRQSLLTYYFPRRTDLVAALLERFNEEAAVRLSELPRSRDPQGALHALFEVMSDRARMRFFLSMLIEADRDAQLRPAMIAHFTRFEAVVAEHLHLSPDDPSAAQIASLLRGLALRQLLMDAADPVENLLANIPLGRKGPLP